MDYETALISRILKNPEEFHKVIDERVTKEYFVDHSALWEYIVYCFKNHGGVPPIDLVEHKFPSFEFMDLDSRVLIYVDELRNRRTHNLIMEGLINVSTSLKNKDPQKALIDVKKLLVKAESEVSKNNVTNVSEDIDSRIKRYEQASSCGGVTGIPSLWPGFDEISQGFHEEELIMIAARSGTGKSWSEVILACENWRKGYVPLLITREMSVWQIIRRFDAVNSRLPFSRFRAGMLTTEEYQRWMASLVEMKEKKHPLYVSGDTDDMGVTGVLSQIQRYRPQIVYIDGGYLLEDERGGKADWEKFKNVCLDLKRVAQREKIPIVMTHQFSKDGIGLEGNADTLKFGDVKMWFDLIIGLYQDEKMRADKELLLKINKARDGVGDYSWVSSWDLDNMVFETKIGLDDIGGRQGHGAAVDY